MPRPGASRSEAAAPAAWLVRDDDVLASLVPAPTGLVAAATPAVTVVVAGTVVIHTFAGAAADVAWCHPLAPGRLEVRRIRCVTPRRLALSLRPAGTVVVAEAGAFERWALAVGDHVSVRNA